MTVEKLKKEILRLLDELDESNQKAFQFIYGALVGLIEVQNDKKEQIIGIIEKITTEKSLNFLYGAAKGLYKCEQENAKEVVNRDGR